VGHLRREAGMRAQIDLVVEDVEATAKFYGALGLEIPELWNGDDGRAHHVEIPDANLGFNSRELTTGYDPAWPAASGIVLIFDVADRDAVDAKHAELVAAGYASHMEPIDAFWGARYAIVDDPDGNHVGLMSASDREHQAAPTL